ncbi:ubiquitin carboxyl-terminal hydrolase 42-like [Leptosomus discolor]
MAPPRRILCPPEKICLDWQQRWGAGAGLYNLGNSCFLNSVLQCLTYTPPLGNYLLSREHSQSCLQQDICVMCAVEEHVNKVLSCSISAIYPTAISNVLNREHFQPDEQEDAHEFFLCTLNAMQTACLHGSSDLDASSQPTTAIHQIFWGSLRSRVTCLSCGAVSDSYEAFLDVPLDIRAASSVAAALEAFVEPERLDVQNCFKCASCNKIVAVSKGFTVHREPKVLTLCLKRYNVFTGRKICKVRRQLECDRLFPERISQSSALFPKLAVQYPEYLDLRPYTSETAGEPLLYSLYAVLVHAGGSCGAGHYFCYIKASDGLWYQMDDTAVNPCDISTVLKQQAYLLFYISRQAAGSKQGGAAGPGFSPSSPCQRTGARERVRSRSPRQGYDLRSQVVEHTDHQCPARRRASRKAKAMIKSTH